MNKKGGVQQTHSAFFLVQGKDESLDDFRYESGARSQISAATPHQSAIIPLATLAIFAICSALKSLNIGNNGPVSQIPAPATA